LTGLLRTFPSGDRGDASEVLATYRIALDGYSLAAVEKAVARFIRGEVIEHDGHFLPNAAILGREVSRCEAMMRPAQPKPVYIAEQPRMEPSDISRQRVRERNAEFQARQEQAQIRPDPLACAIRDGDMDTARKIASASFEGMKLSPTALKIIERQMPTDADVAAYRERNHA